MAAQRTSKLRSSILARIKGKLLIKSCLQSSASDFNRQYFSSHNVDFLTRLRIVSLFPGHFLDSSVNALRMATGSDPSCRTAAMARTDLGSAPICSSVTLIEGISIGGMVSFCLSVAPSLRPAAFEFAAAALLVDFSVDAGPTAGLGLVFGVAS